MNGGSDLPWLADWCAETRRARREASADKKGPLGAGLIPRNAQNPRAYAAAAAEAVVAVTGTQLARVRFGEGNSWADIEGRVVNLDSRLLPPHAPPSPTASEGDPMRVERLLGTAAHEGGHLRYTRRLQRLARRFRRERRPAIRARLMAQLLLRWMINLLEDERIERKLVRRYSALIYPLMEARKQVMPRPPEKWTTLALFLALVRAPECLPHLPASDGERLSAQQREGLTQARDILTPFPGSFCQVQVAAEKLVALIPEVERDSPPDHPGFVVDMREGGGDDNDDVDFSDHGLFARERAEMRRRHGKLRRGRVNEALPPLLWRDVQPDPAGYETIRREVARDASALALSLRALLPPRPAGLRSSGKLKRGRLRNAPFDNRVFEDRGRPGDQLSLVLILDLSGSMAGESEKLAQRLAVLLAEAALCLPRVRLYVYGHSADVDGDCNTVLVRFAAPAAGRPTALGALPIMANNRDAHALDEIRRDLARLDSGGDHPHLAVLLADGAPSAKGFNGLAAVEATRAAIVAFEKAWGPMLFVTTQALPWASRLAPGPTWPFSVEKPVAGLRNFLRWGIGQEIARGRR